SYEIENQGYFAPLIQREDGALYIPYIGWFDPCLRKPVEGPKASHETAWFGLKDNVAYGSEYNMSGSSTLYKWNLSSGEIEKITDVPDSLSYSFNLASNGKIICINM